jgi:hypothetical protein
MLKAWTDEAWEEYGQGMNDRAIGAGGRASAAGYL